MKNITVVVIAHNEQENIGKCLKSILRQTMHANRVIVIIHNSVDGTEKIVREFAKLHSVIEPVVFMGNKGVPYARMEALKYLTPKDEIVLCIDGDSYARSNWVEVMTHTLESRDNILVGSLVKFTGMFYCKFLSIFHWICSSAKNDSAVQWIWGPSFGFQIDKIRHIELFLEKSIILQKSLSLNNSMEDYIRAWYFHKWGNIQVTRETCVYSLPKEKTMKELQQRTKRNLQDKKKLDEYFYTK